MFALVLAVSWVMGGVGWSEVRGWSRGLPIMEIERNLVGYNQGGLPLPPRNLSR